MNSPSNPRAPEPSSKKGCVIGCVAAAIGIPLLLVLGGYFLVMHSSVPLQLAAKAMGTVNDITIKGIDGSISSGFTIEEMRSSDSQGNESVLEGLSLKWSDMTKLRTSRELIIEEIALERAHIYISSSDEEGQTDSPSEENHDRGVARTEQEGTPLELFEIKKVDIREVVIESTTDDFKLELNQILMEGFRIQNDDLELETLTIGSNFIELQLENAEPTTIEGQNVAFTRRLVGSLKPAVHGSLDREIDFTVEMGAIDGNFVNRIQMLDGAVEVINLGNGGLQRLRIDNFNPADYFSKEWQGLLSEISLVVKSDTPDPQTGLRIVKAESGEFAIGNTTFFVEPQILLEEGPEANADAPTPPIIATGKRDGLTITAKLEKLNAPPYFGVSLSSTPERKPRELLALILFNQPFSELNPAQQAEVKDAVKKQEASSSAEAKP
jgi:hypothetical protein